MFELKSITVTDYAYHILSTDQIVDHILKIPLKLQDNKSNVRAKFM